MENKALEIVKNLKGIMDLFRKAVKNEFKDKNLTSSQVMVIAILSHRKEMKTSELSKELGLSNSTVSGIVDRLEEKKLIERIRSKEDRRVIKVRVNKEFKTSMASKYMDVEEKITNIINKSPKEDIDFILKGLENLKKLLEEEIKE
ncbi:MarR family winged helix-turn-helix transcriptional regulator [Geotoga petraea]|uniref:MarR family transcriptional regulator n=1 Tax=Geotoga petraea TaxID=28234 RepID=A0A4Z0W1M8_9BACT|nr:MarR family transcriptional regulator [Geotoga petraea]TGG87990.1 MarR family transcriptional regulator [Geotoga petraea]